MTEVNRVEERVVSECVCLERGWPRLRPNTLNRRTSKIIVGGSDTIFVSAPFEFKSCLIT